MSSIKNKINKLLFEKIETDFHNDNKLVDALHLLLNGNFIKYDFENVNISLSNLKSDDFQTEMFKLNEKSSKRKKNGVYYTPNDVSEYIIANSFINFIDNSINKTINYNEIYNTLINYDNEKLNKILFNSKILDPTCGSGEFLLNTFIMKYNLLKETKNVDDENILKITKTLYGNDIDDESTDISKIRLFMYVYSLLENKDYYKKLTKILINNFTNYDFVLNSNKINNKFEIVVGNPPYVEYGKYDGKEKLINKYGNIYADVIKNSIDLLKCGGILGFIVPLSYVATTRMSKIREYVTEKCSKQILLSFADRPDCLFSGVHQKLNIVIFQKNYNKNKKIYHYLDLLSISLVIASLLKLLTLEIGINKSPIILIVISVFIYTNYTRIIEPNPKINRKSSLYVNDIYMSDGRIYNNYLNKSEKTAYNTLLKITKQRKTSVKIIKQEDETLDKLISNYTTANQAIWIEHPELISYASFSYRYRDDSNYIELSPIYAINNPIEEEINTLLIERKIDKIKQATKNMSDLEKIKYVYEWIGDNAYYDKLFTGSSKNQSIYNVFIKGNAVCAGFAKTSQVIFQNIGIESMIITGYSTGSHMWNVIKYNGKYYYYDSTYAASIRDKTNKNYYDGLKQDKMNYYTIDYANWYPKIETENVLYKK